MLNLAQISVFGVEEGLDVVSGFFEFVFDLVNLLDIMVLWNRLLNMLAI